MGDGEAGQARIHVSCFQGSLLPNKFPPPFGAMALGSQGELQSSSFLHFPQVKVFC